MLLGALAGVVHAEVAVSLLSTYRFGDDLPEAERSVSVDEGGSAALTLHYFDHADSAYDLWLSRYRGDAHRADERVTLDQEAVLFGGRKYWRDGPFYPYLGAGVGVLRLRPDVQQDAAETRAAFSLVGGLSWPLTDAMQLVAEARWLGTVFSSNTALRCGDNGCEWQIQSGTWSQYDLGLGLTVHF